MHPSYWQKRAVHDIFVGFHCTHNYDCYDYYAQQMCTRTCVVCPTYVDWPEGELWDSRKRQEKCGIVDIGREEREREAVISVNIRPAAHFNAIPAAAIAHYATEIIYWWVLREAEGGSDGDNISIWLAIHSSTSLTDRAIAPRGLSSCRSYNLSLPPSHLKWHLPEYERMTKIAHKICPAHSEWNMPSSTMS